MNQNVAEKALIAAAQGGDVHAFNRLVRSYQRLAYNVAYRVLGDGENAADATQDAFLSAFRALPQFRGGSFKAWMLRIVTNECYDQLRRKQRRPEDSLDDLAMEADHSATFTDAQELPEDYALRQELGGAIQKGLMTLPPDQRTVIALADIQGYSYEEIAAIMGVAIGTVKSRLNRGRTRLRDLLLEQKELLPAPYRLKVENW